VSPQPILARVADLLQGRCRALGVRIHLDIPPDGSLVLGDADQLQQLFLNLLRNALDASPEGGTIRVTAGPDSVLPSEGRARILRGKAEVPCLALHIVDGGQGMSAEQLDHVFQPFFSTKRPGQGTGLGLPIAEEIVRAHQGEIELLSIAGRGTEAIVRLPRIGAGPGAPEKAKEPALAAATHER
jgi:signal transduction histidine kinase